MILKIINLLIFFHIFLHPYSSCFEFAAFPDMEALLRNEIHTVDIVENYVRVEVKRLEQLRNTAIEYKTVLNSGLSRVASPLGSYLLMKELYNNWADIELMIRNNQVNDLLANVTYHRQGISVQFPRLEDLQGAAVAIMRLQDVYKLDVKDLAQGKIKGLKNIPKEHLTAHDCYEIGRLAINRFDYYHSLIWLEESLKRLNREKIPTTRRVEVLENLAYSLYQQGNLQRAAYLTDMWLELEPDNDRALESMTYYMRKLASSKNQKYKSDEDMEVELPPIRNLRKYDENVEKQDVFESLCRGEKGAIEADKAKLYCYYKRDRPFLKLAPIKVEIAHLKPKMLFFRQIISDKEIEIVKGLISDKLQTATVVAKYGIEPSPARTAKSGWLYSRNSELISDLNKRLEDMTDLDSKYSEDIHIVKYNIAGHYDPHYDFFNTPQIEKSRRINDDRIATLIFYLEAPDAGGATAFPEINVALLPSKNDAIMWYNLHKNGTIDLNTRHGACAVVSGTKWVGNKWIRERGQEFKRPCSLIKDEYE